MKSARRTIFLIPGCGKMGKNTSPRQVGAAGDAAVKNQ
jgi:hypothetical protein